MLCVKWCKSKWSCIFLLSHLQGSFLLGSDVLLLCVVPELLQARSGQRDATGGEGKREKRRYVFQNKTRFSLRKLLLASRAVHRPSPTWLQVCSWTDSASAVSSPSPARPGLPPEPCSGRLDGEKKKRKRQ